MSKLRDMRILIVEDEYLIADDVARYLERRGAVILGPVPSIEQAERHASYADAAILDVVMPVMGAKELLPELKARRPNMKVLLTSGYSESEARRLCAEYPGAAFIQKPYTAQQIAKAVDDLLGVAGATADCRL